MIDSDPVAPLRLMVRLLQRDAAGIERCLHARPAVLDELVVLAMSGGLAVLLLRALAGAGLTPMLTPAQHAALAGRRERQTARYAALAGGLAHIAGVFDAARLPWMLLKGPYLAARFYGDAQAREFVDIDLLIRPADRRRAFDLLARAGYARRSRMLGTAALTAFFVHGFDYVAGGVSLDLHWGLSRHPSLRIDDERTWQRTRQFTVADRDYAVLADEDEITLAVLGLLRDIERGRPKLRNMVDLVSIIAAVDAAMAWETMLARARHDGTHGPLVNVLSLAVAAADAADLAPRLVAALSLHAARRVRYLSPATLLQPNTARSRLANRLWAARSHDAPLAGAFGWWLASLPFRRAVHGWPRPR